MTDNQGITPEHIRNLGNIPQSSPDPKPESDELDKILDAYYAPIIMPDINRKGLKQALRDRESKLIREAEKRGIAWAIMEIDDMHMSTPTDTYYNPEGIFKGIKYSLRSRAELQAGYDPAPNYPIHVTLAQSQQDKESNNA